ncbi:hypothetical protein ACFU8W_48500 [Streptomyces sp. NPDC057565]|uniref:hypothetical protein n=1 Tax=Streptomyces sp. NPDC057565 TaxID=3346169 RepID=UPI003680CC1C
MTDSGTETVPWTVRMELLKESAQQRVFGTPMPDQVMDRLIAHGKAVPLGPFEGTPVHHLQRWWRHSERGWVALDEQATSQLDLHAERYRAATSATGTQSSAADNAAPGTRPAENADHAASGTEAE